jgi:hypothetical protein
MIVLQARKRLSYLVTKTILTKTSLIHFVPSFILN